MIPSNHTVHGMINAILNKCTVDNTPAALPTTHIDSLDKDIDGISSHCGTDGDRYFRLCSCGKDATLGMNYDRCHEMFRKMLSYAELCSLSGTPAGNSSVRRTGAFFADLIYFNPKDKCTYGVMGYTLGGDYEDSRTDFELQDRDKVFDTYKRQTEDYAREEYANENEDESGDKSGEHEHIWLYYLEEHRYDSFFDKNGHKVDDEEIYEESRTVLIVACCSEETAVRTGLKEYLDKPEKDGTVTPYTFIL